MGWWSTCSNIWLRGGMVSNMFKYMIKGWDGDQHVQIYD